MFLPRTIRTERKAMLLVTLLNKIEKFKSFVYKDAHFELVNGEEAIVVDIEPRKNAKPVCRICLKKCGTHATEKPRLFEYVPLWKWKVYLRYSPRRADCEVDGALVEFMPWAEGKERKTKTYQVYLACWAKRLSWKETAGIFRTSWDSVFRAVKYVVEYGLSHRSLEGVRQIGIDEISYGGHNYLTLVYQLDDGFRRLLWSGPKRRVKTLLKFFRWFGKERSALLEYVSSDMWVPYLKVIRKKAVNALNILDRFHIMKKFNEAIDEIRRQEAKELRQQSEEHILLHSRWPLLKNKSNLSEKQVVKLKELLGYKLRSVKAYLLREDFQRFWQYSSIAWAGKFLDDWTTRTMYTKLDPMKKVARMLRNHKELILNWFRADGKISNGAVEGLNLKAKLAMRKAYGFRNVETLQIALYHTLGKLPEPKINHRFR
jgi:transposase